MDIRLKGILAIIPVILTAFSPISGEKIQTRYYYSLRFLKQSEAPREMKMITIDNIAFHKRMLERGILVTYKSRKAKTVRISGDLSNWNPVAMKRGEYGVWYYFLTTFHSDDPIRYKLIVDNMWTRDPKNPNMADDGRGSYVSLLYPIKKANSPYIPYRFKKNDIIEFQIYKPKAQLISIVGDFNNWNPENNLLTKDSRGFWTIEMRIPRGIYKYKYIIDGMWVHDIFNKHSASDEVGGICSLIKVK